MLKKLLSVILILKKQLMITILILGILVIPGCKKGENGIDTLYRPNKPGDPTQEMLDRSKEEAMNVYKELLANEESDLIELMDWLYEKEGYYYLGDQSQGPYLHTNKGEDYGFDSENTKRLFKILKKYGLKYVTHSGVNEDTLLEKHEYLKDWYLMHILTYHIEETDLDSRSDAKLSDNFYYDLYIGE